MLKSVREEQTLYGSIKDPGTAKEFTRGHPVMRGRLSKSDQSVLFWGEVPTVERDGEALAPC
jgi:hypothetical protein